MDAYNANPSSMESAINSFKKRDGKKTVILGDMFELGKESELEHYKLIKKCIEEKIENFSDEYSIWVNPPPKLGIKNIKMKKITVPSK